MSMISAIGAAAAAAPAAATAGTTGTSSAGFGNALTGALENLQAVQSTSDTLASQAATGGGVNAHDFMIAATEAQLATELTVAVRNKAVEAFNQIMGMQI